MLKPIEFHDISVPGKPLLKEHLMDCTSEPASMTATTNLQTWQMANDLQRYK